MIGFFEQLLQDIDDDLHNVGEALAAFWRWLTQTH